MLEKLFAAGRAINAGEILANPATWKNRQLAMNAILVILGAIAAFVPNLLGHVDLQVLAAGIAAVGGLLNAYLTAATSTKVGLPPRGNPDSPIRPDGALLTLKGTDMNYLLLLQTFAASVHSVEQLMPDSPGKAKFDAAVTMVEAVVGSVQPMIPALTTVATTLVNGLRATGQFKTPPAPDAPESAFVVA